MSQETKKDKNGIPKVTPKDTKSVIYEALEVARKVVEEKSKIDFNPVLDEKEKENSKTLESAKVSVEHNYFSDEINEKYHDVCEAVRILEEKLATLYKLDASLQDIVVIQNAHTALLEANQKELNDFFESSEKEKKKKQEEYDEMCLKQEKDFSEKMNEYKQKEDAYNAQFEESKKKAIAEFSELQRKAKADWEDKIEKEKNEYKYKKDRQRKIDDDEWNDICKVREAEMKEKENATLELLQKQKEHQAEYESLKAKVEEIPSLLDEARLEGISEGKEKAEKSNGFETRALKSKHEHEIELKEMENGSLKSQNDRLKSELIAVQEKLEKAYAQINDLATKTVESSGVRIIGTDSSNGKK